MRLHHGGRVVRTRDDSVEFEDMFEDVLIFSESHSLTQLVDRVKVRLGWSEGDVHVQFEGVIDVGSCKGPRIKRLLKITSEFEWNDYKTAVLVSEVRSLDLVVTKEYGIGIENIEACPSFDTRIENGPSLEEEIVLTQPTYGGNEGLGSAEGDEGCFLMASEMITTTWEPMVMTIMMVMMMMSLMELVREKKLWTTLAEMT